MNRRIRFGFQKRFSALFFILAVATAAAGALGQQQSSSDVLDPGPRADSIDAGGFLLGLTAAQQAQAADGAMRFMESETFPGGLGPLYNSGTLHACGGCHAQPNMGGSSPSASAYPYIGPNPQATEDYNAYSATNVIPPFITASGPVREMRLDYFHNSDGSLNLGAPDGGVHDLFTVTGRTDNTTCTLAQPNFAQEVALGNAIFRIPTPVFGAGLIENIDDATILANQAASQSAAAALGIPIAGQVNRSGNDGTITRFGWKAQNKSLLIFAGEAYNVEDGVTNELFATQRPTPGTTLPPGCKINATPEDRSNPELAGTAVNSDVTAFAAFMRMLAPPTPAASTPQTLLGQQIFSNIGCALCHTPTMTTAQSSEAAALSNVPANLYSDLLVHNMGVGLADGVSQGGANGQQFRSAPLWGVGQRVFFLHDGRTSDLAEAIRQHKSHGSEANQVIDNFENLSHRDKKNLILFLRSL
jgi:CxxC motif-containing protein (DUF1111 family)